MIYLDNASTSFPKPEAVYRRMDEFARQSGNPGRGGHLLARRAEQEIERVRTLVARFFKASSQERVIFTLNATDALNMALKGFLRPGDHVLTSCLEHNAVSRPLARLAQNGVTFTRVECDSEGKVDVASLEKQFERNTRLLVLTWVSNVTGTVQPISSVAEICRRRGVKLLVDAAQAAGHVPIDMSASGIDMLACSGHKGLLGPPGTGLLILSDDVDLAPLREGGTGVASNLALQPDTYPQRLESGTPNTVGIAGLGAAVEFLLEIGQQEIAEHERRLIAILQAGLSAIASVKIYGSTDPEHRSGILSFNIEGWEPAEVAAVLDHSFGICCRAGLHCSPWAHEALGTYPGGTVRLSVGYFNTLDDVKKAVDAVKSLVSARQNAVDF